MCYQFSLSIDYNPTKPTLSGPHNGLILLFLLLFIGLTFKVISVILMVMIGRHNTSTDVRPGQNIWTKVDLSQIQKVKKLQVDFRQEHKVTEKTLTEDTLSGCSYIM